MESNETVTSLGNALLKICGISDISLVDGTFGYVVPLYGLSRKFVFISAFADSLLEDCIENVTWGWPFGFSSGISGIGWVIEFLIGKGYIDGNPDEVLWEFDRKVEELSLLRIHDNSWDNGLYGIVLYILIRIASSRNRANGEVFKDSFITELEELVWHDEEVARLAGLNFDELLEKGYSLFLDLISRQNPTLYSFVELIEALEYEPVKDNLDHPAIYIFTEECRGQKYGVGTYLNEMIAIRQLKDNCNTTVVHLRSDTDVFSITRTDSITHLWFPDLSNLNVGYGVTPQLRYSKVIATCVKTFHEMFCHGVPTVCHTNFYGWTDMVMYLKNMLPAKIVHTMHYSSWSFETLGDVCQLREALISSAPNRIKSSFLKESQYLKDVCDMVIAISQHSYDSLISLYCLERDKVVYISNTVGIIGYPRAHRSEIRERYGLSKDAKIVIFAGRMDPVKGLEHLIMNMRRIIEQDRSVILAIAGSGSFQKYMELAKPYSRNILFLGFLNKEELFDWYQAADVGVVSSLYEEFGYVCVEMLMMGMPVIANDTTGLREIIRSSGAGVLVDIKDYDHTSEAITSMLTSMGDFPKEHNIGKLALLYGRNTFAQRIINLYECLIG